ncbi:MAG: type II toxin-antitoxin system RelE/ParE family toxin [Deltaproteobacteria bacterium]|nr:type II toxin-antitoxin system RelE/ParE family toxin [Deltaproteobacteria bacterium]
MINSFKDKELEKFFLGRQSRVPRSIFNSLRRRLDYMLQAQSLDDLRALPGNRLEKLRGPRDGQHSIRVNDQWRLCFTWSVNGIDDLELIDYH